MSRPKIVTIPPKMERYFGNGKMLHPGIEMVETMLEQIPKGKLSTIDLIGQKMAAQWSADITCPMRLGNAIKKIASSHATNDQNSLPYWRVLKKEGFLIKSKRYEFAAACLEDEGFELDFNHRLGIRVKDHQDYLFKW